MTAGITLADIAEPFGCITGSAAIAPRTAAALAVNRSTVRCRLHRIRELTGLEPDDARSIGALRDIANPHPRD